MATILFYMRLLANDNNMIRLFLVLFFLVFQNQFLSAGKIDEMFLKKLTGTKWELIEEKKYGKLIPKKNKKPNQETITFSDGSILFDLPDQHYACNFTVRNKYEYWLYCTEPDQYIYKIHSLNSRVLVIDMLVKDRAGKYSRKKRLTFHIKL